MYYQYLISFIYILSICSAIANNDENRSYQVPSYLRNKYGKNRFDEEPSKPSHSFYEPDMNYEYKCKNKPIIPANSKLFCSEYKGCKAECFQNYQFPNGLTHLFITCQNGQWRTEGLDFATIPDCQPICSPSCVNNGICLAPNKCDCPDNFAGPQCQYKSVCLSFPILPKNSKRSCNSKECTVTCLKGHEFPDGSEIATAHCYDGVWVPNKDKWKTIPDCRPVCNPPCENGGNCLSYNTCQCPQDFRGPQCQYSASKCNPKKLKFNGNFRCSGDNEIFNCTIFCPSGINFEFHPVSSYSCRYEDGIFYPQPIPQCQYPDNVRIIATDNLKEVYQKNVSYITLVDNLFPNPDIQYHHINKQDILPGQEGNSESLLHTIEKTSPMPGVCFTWNGEHFKTFDGKVFSFHSNCPYILVRDGKDNTFSIEIESNCNETNNRMCNRLINIYLQNKKYILKNTEGKPTLMSGSKVLPIPAQLPGLRAEMYAHNVFISLDSCGTTLKWDGHQMVQVEVGENLWNRTEGLCGNMDGNINNDFRMKDGQFAKSISNLAYSWKIKNLENECDDIIEENNNNDNCDGKEMESIKYCKKLLSSKKFSDCHKILDFTSFLNACQKQYCKCIHNKNPASCSCETINIYVRNCYFKGVKGLIKWRDDGICPIHCDGGKIYKSCGPKNQPVCGTTSLESENEELNCIEGCFCPMGKVLYDNRCIKRDECPCLLRGKLFPPGKTVKKDCNTCTCVKGSWVCTFITCGARCSAIGDPHYMTFDGKKYDFMGKCSYYLVKTNNFSIEAENVACTGAISQAMNLPVNLANGLPSCTKSVTIKINGQNIKLKQNHEILVNGQDIIKLPYKINNIIIKIISSIFLQVELPNGVEIWWDGVTRVYIDVPPLFKEKTKGLCGTFNHNQKDDFLTPENDIEQSIIPFANKWKTSEKCNDIPDELKSHPCVQNIHNKEIAENHCNIIKSNLFEECHWYVDPEPYYQDCLYDLCSCENKISNCFCPIMAAYAAECSRKDIKIDWRNNVKECGIHCSKGQKYQICASSCTRSCLDISLKSNCNSQCVEGCNCPDGETLDENGNCIPIGQCKCQYDGFEYDAGHKEIRITSKGKSLCTCINALWSCRLATDEDIKTYPSSPDKNMKARCNETKNMVFTNCEPVEPITCKNMNSLDYTSAFVCHPGCKCKEGYVLNTKTKECIKPTECPCHHGGKSFNENSTIQNDCNTCICESGKWICTDRPCSGTCTAWGDSHFKTFDGKNYDYQGQCDYVLSKGTIEESSFDVVIQNVPCGTLGTTCSKSVTLRIRYGDDQESVTLTQDKLLPNFNSMKHLIIRNSGLFVVAEVPSLALILHWDKGTRVYLKLNPKWKDRVVGLCGNFNDNEEDDFLTPSGGITEISSKLFGDSWKLQPYCPETTDIIIKPCDENPERKIWALKKCSILKENPFSLCHSEVPVNIYYEKCIFDTCACDQGGDCECLCTVLAAYAQECNNRGVPIKWRSQNLCPIQCDERCAQYSACISTCPIETCDNFLINSKVSTMCNEDTCIEGCAPKPCPDGHIYLNSSYLECIPKTLCKPLCMKINDTLYYEGDIIDEDDCHSCTCSRGNKICKGSPCTTTTLAPTTLQMDKIVQCHSGWTAWINQNKLKKSSKNKEIEPLPGSLVMDNLEYNSSRCAKEFMVDIECRTVKGHLSPKETRLDVECSLESGLICKSHGKGKLCPDFEIRIKCDCDLPSSAECDVAKPYKDHPNDCHKFYQCVPQFNRVEFVEKTCGKDMMYNPITMICDWPQSVIQIKPECEEAIHLSELIEPENPKCPPGEIMDDCAIQCDRLCLYYKHILTEQGLCLNDNKCESGCTTADKNLKCSSDMFWVNNETCVYAQNCPCTTFNGKLIKPGGIYKESDCEICQCIENNYACDQTNCDITTTVESPIVTETVVPLEKTVGTTTLEPLIISTFTPPEKCDEKDYINIIQGDEPLPDDVFSASSQSSSYFLPKYARITEKINIESGGSWIPKISNKHQYLQINLGHQEPIYGVIIKGSTLYSEYVTSFTVSYSNDENDFYPVLNKTKNPQIFRGSFDSTTPIKQIFDTPFEAQFIRINPQTWHNQISLRVELIGCKEITLSSTIPSTQVPLCEDSMGLAEGMMQEQQVIVSSELVKGNKYYLKINQNNVWQPSLNSPTEYVQFDFLEPTILTGFISKGGPKGWITLFHVKYSDDNKNWHPIINKDNEMKTFLGNFDEDSEHFNKFDLPIKSRYLKIIPIKWHNNIQLRIEIYGCFKPPSTTTPTYNYTPSQEKCNYCPGILVKELELGACYCDDLQWWNGTNCVNKSSCPCLVGDMSYQIGSIFEKEDCSQCICKLGGVPVCSLKKCEPCKGDRKSILTSTCQCSCENCPKGTKLCPTSNFCLNSTLWCNGVEDCPDDEKNCTFESVSQEITCPIFECPSNFRKELIKESSQYKVPSNSMFASEYGRKQKTKTNKYFSTKKGGIKRKQPIKTVIKTKESIKKCPEYRCVSLVTTECTPIMCPTNYTLHKEMNKSTDKCPRYSCYPPANPDATCDINGNIFHTFDNITYKYEICNHMLVRDLKNFEWDILLKKNCSENCSKILVIRHQDKEFTFYPDLSIELDGYKYNINQIKKINFDPNIFVIERIGNVMMFISNYYGFWAIWNGQYNIKIGVISRLQGKVDGLCGYFNNLSKDDRRKPDGSLSKTTNEFGDSWELEHDRYQNCVPVQGCAPDIRLKSLDICNKIKDKVFSSCTKYVDIDSFISRCVDMSCECLEKDSKNHKTQDECKCKILQQFVIECLNANSNVDLYDWRIQMDCPVTCESPLIYHDCYRRKCEPTCESISNSNSCPKLSNVCFPGCYCPEDLVRKNNLCIKPSSCLDCECNVYPHLEYVTYDKSNFSLNADCVYVMSRDKLIDKKSDYDFQLLITNTPCKFHKDKECVGKITILYEDHKIHVVVDYNRKKLIVIVDGEKIEDFNTLNVVNIRQTNNKHLKISITKILVEINVFYPSLGVTIKVPSHKYKGKLEGLCGNCNGDQTDDFQLRSGKIVNNTDEFALDWLYEKLPIEQDKEMCKNKPKEICSIGDDTFDPCLQLLDVNTFGQCLNILDPSIFIDWCKKDTCGNKPEMACTSLEAYARECANAGFCINWRTNLCPHENCTNGKIYDPCGSSCIKTCDNLKENSFTLCKSSGIRNEGCFCPEGKVLSNGTCILERYCQTCDEDGHHDGDKWKKNKCTTCTCKGTNLICESQHCPDTNKICEKGYQLKEMSTNEDECCPKYICILEAINITTCEIPQKPDCAPDQIMKFDTKSNGCHQFICECKPKDQCEDINLYNETASLEVGYQRQLIEKGCCPKIELICNTTLCPEPPQCEHYYILKEENQQQKNENKCCPLYKCEPPKDKCIYESQFISSEIGGERPRKEIEKQKLLKLANESWNDGPCRKCVCDKNIYGHYSVKCMKNECPLIETMSDYFDYELESEYVVDQCCPKIKKTACKFYDKVYQIGENWMKDDDYCSKFECLNTTESGVLKEIKIIQCNKDCDPGFEYVTPSPDSKECCGSCKQTACIFNETIYEIGERWHSPDYCKTYLCLNNNGSVQIVTGLINCPRLSMDLENNFVYETKSIDKQCCREFKKIACKSDNETYQIGEVWPSLDGNKCKNITCILNDNGDIVKQELLETCNKDCAKGWIYQDNNETCCGSCVQIGCLVNDEIRPPGETWNSNDNCTSFTCNEEFSIITQKKTCPHLENCPKENIYVKDCCQYCNLTVEAHSTCIPIEIPENTTIGIIKINRTLHGECINKEPIKRLKECKGHCPSSTYFNFRKVLHENICTCCQAKKYDNLEVDLICSDGHKWTKKIATPISCTCGGCTQNKIPTKH